MGRFKPRDLRDGTSLEEIRRTLNEIQKELRADLDSALGLSRVTSVQTSDFAAGYGDVVRVAPPSTGLRVILPPVNLAQPQGFVTVVVEGTAGALSAEAVDTTINGSTTLTFLAGLGKVEFRLTPSGWYSFSASLHTVPLTSLASQDAETFNGNFTASSAPPTARAGSSVAGAGLTYTAGGTLAVGAGDGIDVNADDVAVDVTDIVDNVSITEVATNNIQRAALTGAIVASAGLNATTFSAGVAGAGLALSGGSTVIDYVGSTGTIALGAITGAQGVVNIAALACGGIVNAQPSGNYDIDGFTAKTEGFWFVFVDRNTAAGAVGTFNNNAGNTTTSIRPPGAVAFTTFTFGRAAIFVYTNTRWRPLIGATA